MDRAAHAQDTRAHGAGSPPSSGPRRRRARSGTRFAPALGDPTLDVLYWVPAVDGFVDADGALRSRPVGTATRVTRGGRLLAVVVHDDAAFPGGDLERLLGPAARLAIENEALRAEVLAQLAGSCAARGRGSSRPRTSRGGAWSATCTTAPSSAC